MFMVIYVGTASNGDGAYGLDPQEHETAPGSGRRPLDPAYGGLCYRSHLGWEPIPAWARTLFDFGSWLANTRGPQPRVLALVLPTRTFAGPFILTGTVIGAARMSYKSNDPAIHFEILASLPVGTPVTVRDGSRQKRGILLGTEVREGARRIRVQVEKPPGELTHSLPPSLALRVRPIEADLSADQLPKNQKGKALVRHAGFLGCVLGGLDSYEYALHSEAHGLLVGNTRILRHEIFDPRLGAKAANQRAVYEGKLQDVLRVRQWQATDQHFRSDVLTASPRGGNGTSAIPVAPLVIFDGAEGFVRLRHHWPDADWVVVLDRTARSFSDGVAALVQDWVKRDDNLPAQGMPVLPVSEVLAYGRRAR